jgi:hypothetical protein
MLRRTPIFVAVDPAEVSSGLQPDKHPLHVTLWETAENVTFFSGRVKRRVPPALLLDVGADPIRGLSQQQATNGVRWLWAASGGKVQRWFNGAAETMIASGTWRRDETATAPATFWDFTHYGDWTIINNGQGQAQIHKPPAVLAAFGDSPSDVALFMKKLSFMMALGYGARGTRVGWSDSSSIEVWTPTDSNNASSISIDDFDTPIRAAAPLGQSIAVFAEDQMALVNYIGAPFYFGQRVVLDGIGAVGPCAVASDGSNNVGVGQGGIWWTDSNTYRYIDEGALHDYLQNNVNWAQKSKIQALRNDYTGCYEFFFPMGVSVDVTEGWSFDPRTGGWSKLPALSMKVERRLFGRPVLGTNDGKVQLDNYNAALPGPLALETRPLLMQIQTSNGLADAHTDSRVDEVLLLIKAATGVEFRLKSAERIGDAYEVSDWLPVDPTSRTTPMPAMPSGVYWKLEFRSTVDNWDLDLQGFMLYGVVEGTGRNQQ